MKIVEMDLETRLILKFKYKDREYSMNVVVINRSSEYIIIPAVLELDLIVPPENLIDAELLMTVKDGVYQFRSLKIEPAYYQGMRVYYVSTQEEINRLNRRQAYRVFIGEVVTVRTTDDGGFRKEYEGILKNISVLGMCVILKNELDIGTTLNVAFTYEGLIIPLVGTIIRKDKVARYRAYSYGCQFKDLNNSVNRVIVMKQLKEKGK